jgi:hypothetical protein
MIVEGYLKDSRLLCYHYNGHREYRTASTGTPLRGLFYWRKYGIQESHLYRAAVVHHQIQAAAGVPQKEVITHAKEAKDTMQIPRLSRAM